jgi:hypothetical protein
MILNPADGLLSAQGVESKRSSISVGKGSGNPKAEPDGEDKLAITNMKNSHLIQTS